MTRKKSENGTATKPRKPKQQFIPGAEPPMIQVVEDAASTYYDVMIDRCKLSKEEDEAKDNLIDKMKEHGLDRYETADGLVVTVTAKSNVKCKRKKDAEENGDADE